VTTGLAPLVWTGAFKCQGTLESWHGDT